MRAPVSVRAGVLVAVALGSSCRPPAEDDARVEPTATAGTWVERESKACGFAVTLPPGLSAQPTPPGLLDQLAIEDDTLKMTMIASCGDVPAVSSAQDFLEVTSRIIAQQLHARIDQITPLELAGRPGLELAMIIPAAQRPEGIFWPGDLSYRLRLYVSGRRQYQLHAVHSAGALVHDLEARFFAGFRLLDDAPPVDAPIPWATHTLGPVTVEAPGAPTPVEASSLDLLEATRFAHEGRTTPYGLSQWRAELPGAPSEPSARLRAHFLLRIATEHTEIVSETKTTVAGRPALDLHYRPNTPLPEHIAPDAQTREAVRDLIERAPSEFRVRLILVDDRIVQLRAANATEGEEPDRFFDSVRVPE